MTYPISQRLSHEVGWGYKDVVDRLEEKRKTKAAAFYERKVGLHPSLFSLAHYSLTITFSLHLGCFRQTSSQCSRLIGREQQTCGAGVLDISSNGPTVAVTLSCR